MTQPQSGWQFSIRTLLLIVLAFACGFGLRNVISGLQPWAIQASLPASTSPVAPGDTLIVESSTMPEINRRVTVLADGVITMPLIGTVQVSGQNQAAIEQTLTQAYAKYYKNPGIQVYRGGASEPLK